MKFEIKFPLSIYAIWYLLILLFQIFLQPFYKSTSESLTLYQRLYWSWTSYWDSGHYVTIAKQGYNFPQQAFFPLWPLTIKVASFVVGSTFVASFILSFIFGLTAFVLFYLLAKKLLLEKEAKLALILFATFPSTMFLHAAYSEGLFLSLTLLSFLLLEKKLPFFSAIAVGFASMSRITGIAISVSYFCLKQKIINRFSMILISLTGLFLYMLFLQIKFGNPLMFIEGHKAWCGVQNRCQIASPLIPLISYAQALFIGWVKPGLNSLFLDWFFAVLFLGMLVPVFKRFNLNYFVYSLIVLLMPLASGTIVGMVRFVLLAFPVFFVVPKLVKSKILFFIICLLLFLLQLRFITLFTNRIWVA